MIQKEDYRSKNWFKNRELAIQKIGYQIEEWIEELVLDAVQDYVDSRQFEEDACDHCREAGWKEPE